MIITENDASRIMGMYSFSFVKLCLFVSVSSILKSEDRLDWLAEILRQNTRSAKTTYTTGIIASEDL